MLVFFMLAFCIAIGAPFVEDHYLGIGAIGFPLFAIAAVFLHRAELTPAGAFFSYLGIAIVAFGIAALIHTWKREPFAGIVLSAIGAIFYVLPLEGQSIIVFFVAFLVMLFVGLWITHQHLDRSHHITKQQIEAVALCSCLLSVLMVLVVSTPMLVYMRIFVRSWTPALPRSTVSRMLIPVLLIAPLHFILARKLEPEFRAEDDIDHSFTYAKVKEGIPA